MRIRVAPELYAKIFMEGSESHFRITKGVPPDVELVNVTLEQVPKHTPPVIVLHFDDGRDTDELAEAERLECQSVPSMSRLSCLP